MVWLYIIIILISCLALIKSTDWIIRSLTYLANYFKLPEFVIAFILAGLATSAPELFIGIQAGLNNIPILSLSDVLGSNLVDLTLILGLTLILSRGLSVEKKVIKYNITYTFILLIYPLFLLLDKEISRLDGAALLILFSLYLIILYRQSQRYSKREGRVFRKDLIKNIAFFVLGIGVLLISAQAIVKSAQNLAVELNIQLFIIGVFLVALGTSLPELAVNIKAIHNHGEMSLGNILGSVAANSALILGVTALIYPIQVTEIGLVLISIIFMVGSFILFAVFTRTKEKLSWPEGIIMILIYIAFIIFQSFVK